MDSWLKAMFCCWYNAICIHVPGKLSLWMMDFSSPCLGSKRTLGTSGEMCVFSSEQKQAEEWDEMQICQRGNLITAGTDNHIREISYMRINYREAFRAVIIPNKDVEEKQWWDWNEQDMVAFSLYVLTLSLAVAGVSKKCLLPRNIYLLKEGISFTRMGLEHMMLHYRVSIYQGQYCLPRLAGLSRVSGRCLPITFGLFLIAGDAGDWTLNMTQRIFYWTTSLTTF